MKFSQNTISVNHKKRLGLAKSHKCFIAIRFCCLHNLVVHFLEIYIAGLKIEIKLFFLSFFVAAL